MRHGLRFGKVLISLLMAMLKHNKPFALIFSNSTKPTQEKMPDSTLDRKDLPEKNMAEAPTGIPRPIVFLSTWRLKTRKLLVIYWPTVTFNSIERLKTLGNLGLPKEQHSTLWLPWMGKNVTMSGKLRLKKSTETVPLPLLFLTTPVTLAI